MTSPMPSAAGEMTMPEPTCKTCGDTGNVPVSPRGSDGYDRCPDCQPDQPRSVEELTEKLHDDVLDELGKRDD